jgi:PhnB protein
MEDLAMSHIPEGYAAVTPYLCVEGADDFLRFVERAFGAHVGPATRGDDGRVRHAEFVIEGVAVECSDAPSPERASRVGLHVFVADPDAAHARALAAGATETYPVTTHPYGERSGGVRDRWGIDWYLARVTDPVARAR